MRLSVFYRAMHYTANLQSALLGLHVVCLSVCETVTLVDHTGWKPWNCTDN